MSILTVRSAELEQQTERVAPSDKAMAAINRVSATKLTADEVHIRGMYLCNSKRDYYYSKFSRSALDEVSELVVGRPVMVGHDYRTLPVGRFFEGETVFRGATGQSRKDSYWNKSLFYMPKDEEGDALAKRIDTGIYREVSIGWRCVGADCGICGEPVMDKTRCPHIPGEVYDRGVADFEFSGITGVLEGSLVFAGGQKDTSTFVPERMQRTLPWPNADDDVLARDVPSFKRGVTGLRKKAEPMRASVQAIMADKTYFESRGQAARWVRDHDFRADRYEESDGDFVFTQFSNFDEKTARMRRIDDGIKARVAKKPAPGARVVTLDALFGGASG